jgi:hypothetical protein
VMLVGEGIIPALYPVGWVERSETHRLSRCACDGFRKNPTHPTSYRIGP